MSRHQITVSVGPDDRRDCGTLAALRDGLTAPQAAALITVLTWQPAYAQLIGDHGWSFDDCERWLKRTLESALLG